MNTSELLQKLELGDEDVITYLSAEETGLDIDIMNVVMTGFGDMSNTAEGDFFFLGEKEPEFFVSRITMVSDVLADNLAPLCLELAVTDFKLALGAFSYDPDSNSVIYTLRVPLEEGLSEKEILDEANVSIRLALNMARSYAAQYAYMAHRR